MKDIARDILEFWFVDTPKSQHYVKDPKLDAQILARFGPAYEDMIANGHEGWLGSKEGTLGAVILLDQFSRNMFRDDPRAFAEDARALLIARHAIEAGHDKETDKERRGFYYLPFMHSEDRAVQGESLALFKAFGNETMLDFAIKHKEIIDRFGRYPHRNEVLGRISTPEEFEFLKEHSGF